MGGFREATALPSTPQTGDCWKAEPLHPACHGRPVLHAGPPDPGKSSCYRRGVSGEGPDTRSGCGQGPRKPGGPRGLRCRVPHTRRPRAHGGPGWPSPLAVSRPVTRTAPPCPPARRPPSSGPPHLQSRGRQAEGVGGGLGGVQGPGTHLRRRPHGRQRGAEGRPQPLPWAGRRGAGVAAPQGAEAPARTEGAGPGPGNPIPQGGRAPAPPSPDRPRPFPRTDFWVS